MSIVGLLLLNIVQILKIIVNGYMWIIIISALLSWVRPDPSNPIVRILYQITEPVYRFVRRKLPQSFFSSGIDFTPMIIIFALILLDGFVLQLLLEFAIQLRYPGSAPQQMMR